MYSIEEYNLSGFPGQPLTPILSYSYHLSVDDDRGMPKKEENTQLETIKKKGQYYQIKLVTNTNGRRKNVYYRYSEESNSCVEVADHRRGS